MTTPANIARTIALLASEDAAFLTGQAISVLDGPTMNDY